MNFAEDLKKFNKPEMAIMCFEFLKTMQPENPDIFKNAGDLFLKSNKIKEAESNYLEALKIDPNFSDAYVALGIVEQSMRNTDKAQDMFDEALKIDPENFKALNNKGYMY